VKDTAARFLFLLCIPLISHAETEIKGDPEGLRAFLHPSQESVLIRGHGEEKAYANTAVVSLVVTTENKKLSTSIAGNARTRKVITAALQKAGIQQQAIRNSKFSSSPQYGWFSDEPKSYLVNNRMAVTIDTETQLETIAKIADSNTQVQIVETEFVHTERRDYRNRVLSMAFDQVMQEKAFYEKTLGIKLVPVGIEESLANQDGSAGAKARNDISISQESSMESKLYRAESARYQEPAASFDEVVYSADVAVKFNIVR
jgi:uncharacterized protein YggE